MIKVPAASKNESCPALSIITPVFNGEKFIEFCLKNVISSLPLPIEHIICDGGSTDQTIEIVKKYAIQYPHIRWISQKDRGQSDAMNHGVALAQADVIGFLNADDFYEKNTLKNILELIKKSAYPTIWMGNCRVLKEGDVELGINVPTALNFYKLIANYEFPYNPSAYFYHKKIHEQAGMYLIEDHYTMDLEFLLRAYKKSIIHYAPMTWGNFRLIAGTKTFGDTEQNHSQARCDELRKHAYESLNWIEKKIVDGYKFKKRAINFIKRAVHKFSN